MDIALNTSLTRSYYLKSVKENTATKGYQVKENEVNGIVKTDEIADGDVLGIGFINGSDGRTSYGMVARYAKESTEENPIIQVSLRKSSSEVETYNISMNEINPSNATELEMFALCNYADDKKIGTNGTFGSWQTLKCIDINACTNGYVENTNSLDKFRQVKKDWINSCSIMMNEYLSAGILKQYHGGMNLMNMFSKFV